MKRSTIHSGLGMILLVSAGCQDTTPPPPTSSVPPVGTYTHLRGELPKPLPDQDKQADYQPPFKDEALLTQAPPEQPAFTEAYAKVGNPRIALFVNRTLAGIATVPPTTPPDKGREQAGAGGIELPPPARIDYDAVETILTDWFAAGGKVSLVSAKLSEAQVQAVTKGEHNALKELSEKQQIDVLIFVQAAETKQTPRGVEVRLIGEAINTVGGESIGRAVVDAPPILEKRVINEYTRFMARKLMKDMTGTWNNAPQRAPVTEIPPPQEQPATQPNEPLPPEPIRKPKRNFETLPPVPAE